MALGRCMLPLLVGRFWSLLVVANNDQKQLKTTKNDQLGCYWSLLVVFGRYWWSLLVVVIGGCHWWLSLVVIGGYWSLPLLVPTTRLDVVITTTKNNQ